MARVKSVIDLLSEQPEDQLRKMRDGIREELTRAQGEVQRLTVEAQLIDQALLKRSRDGQQPSRVTAAVVLQAVREAGAAVTVADVLQRLADGGYNTTANAIRNHLNRMNDRGDLLRIDDRFTYVPKADDFPTAPTDDDIPF